ncbi:MAG: hypothetical protein IKG11_03025, partial [Atopobiaceae bacterium]|nr:hypothetical protein [Atopobiaceae bacterium]
MSKRPWFCEMGVRARKMLSVLLALELCVAGVPVTAFAEEGVDDQEVLAQADGAIVSVEQNTEGEEPELLEGHLYLYQSAESPYFDDGELRTQSVTPGLEDKLTDEECERIKSALVQVADLADSNYYVSLTNCELNYDEVQAIIMDVINSHPEYWYVNSTFTYVETSPGSDIIQRFYLQYLASGSKLDTMKAKYNQNMSDLLSWIPKNATVEQMIKVVHDWLVRNAVYDEPAGSIHKSDEVKKYREETGRDPWSAYGAMVEHQPVCQGYSLAFLSAMCHLGIEADVVGTATHQWNRVKINDTWYHVDVTWDDPVPDQGFNINPMPTWYFLKSDGGVAAEDDQSHIVHKDWQLAKPVCPDTSYDGKTDWATYTGPAGDKVPVTALTITVPDGPGDD